MTNKEKKEHYKSDINSGIVDTYHLTKKDMDDISDFINSPEIKQFLDSVTDPANWQYPEDCYYKDQENNLYLLSLEPVPKQNLHQTAFSCINTADLISVDAWDDSAMEFDQFAQSVIKSVEKECDIKLVPIDVTEFKSRIDTNKKNEKQKNRIG